MSVKHLNELIKGKKISVQEMNYIYNKYRIAFIIKDGQIKGFTK